MKKYIALLLAFCTATAVMADSWTPNVNLVAVEPLLSWNGGMVRVLTDRTVTTALCGNATVFDMTFSGGTQESRSALLSALYMALAANKQVQLYVSSSLCSPVGAPLITGMHVVN